MGSHWPSPRRPLLLLGVASPEDLCPKIRQFARLLPQTLHPQQPDDLCSQTYPQKMGIDNLHASGSDQRAASAIFFVESDAEVTAEESEAA